MVRAKLKFRLHRAVIVLICLALLVALMQGASWFSQNSQKQRNPQLEELARTLAQQVVLNLAPLMRSETPDEKRINQLLTQLTHNSRVLDAGVYDEQGDLVACSGESVEEEILYQRRQLHQLHDIADFAGDIADRTAFQFLKNFSTQWQLIGHAAIRREKSPVCVDDFVSAEKIITKQGFIDTLAVKPDGLVGLPRLLVLRHGAAPPFPDV